MADETQNRALPETFDPDTYYRVQLKRAVQFAGRTHSPGKSQRFLGSVAEQFRDDLASAEVDQDGFGDPQTA